MCEGQRDQQRLGSLQAKCTDEQLAVISARNVSLLVAASAGTGKTFTLTQRIISRVLDSSAPLDLDRLLVVTFTDAAAKEMRERIRNKLLEELEKDPENNHLRMQVRKIGRAQISTIDSFFREIIRRYSYLLGLEPSPPVLDEAEADVLQASVVNQVFERLYESDDPEFIDLVDCYGRGVNDQKLKDLVLRIFAYENSLPDIQQWERKVLSLWQYNVESLNRHPWVEVLREAAIRELESCKAKLNYCLALCSETKGLAEYIPTLEEDLAAIESSIAVLQAGEWSAVLKTLPTFGSLKAVKAEPERRKRVQDIRNDVKATTKKLQTEWFGRSLVDYACDFPQDLRRVACLLRIVSQLREEYTDLKQRLGVVDFSDLARLSLAILMKDADGPRGGPVAYELREQYDEVLIDEYQDTNQIQDYILALVSRDGAVNPGQAPNRIMIGDVKQSIYRFRLADPSIFRHKLKTYSEGSRDKRTIPLSVNFRSRKEILDATNFVFKQIMQSALVELDYGESDQLVCGAEWLHSTSGTGGKTPSTTAVAIPDADTPQPSDGTVPVELYVFDTKSTSAAGQLELSDLEEEFNGADDVAVGAFEMEAQLVARRIRELTREKTLVFDSETKNWRPIRYGDIAILLRTAKNRSQVVAQVLRSAGIPVVSMGKVDLFSFSETKLLMSLLQVIDNPRRSPQLCMVLLSAIGGFTVNDIAEIRICHPDGELYDSIIHPVTDPSLEEKRRTWLSQLSRWRDMAKWCGVSDLVRRLLADIGEGKFLQDVPDLPQRRENLRLFAALSDNYEKNHLPTLGGFIRYLEELKAVGGYEPATNSIDPSVDAVKIMTIHNSKGLEFPIVFLPDLGKKFNLQDSQQDVIFQQELGIGLKHVDLTRKEKWPSLSSLAVGVADEKAAVAEEMRILYVAMTRARERLILIGSTNLAGALQRWTFGLAERNVPLPTNLVQEARSVLDWLGPCVMRHRDGKPLREAAGSQHLPASVMLWEDPSSWYVSIGSNPMTPCADAAPCETEAAPAEQIRVRLKQLEPLAPAKVDYRDIMEPRYEHQGLTEINRAYAVTDLTEALVSAGNDSAAVQSMSVLLNRLVMRQGENMFILDRREDAALLVPRFAAASVEEATGAQRGSAVHKFIQLATLKPELTEVSYVIEELTRLVEVGRLSEEEANLVDPSIVARFFRSDLGQRFFAPGVTVERELAFTSTLSVGDLGNPRDRGKDLLAEKVELKRGDFVVLRGVIDCVLVGASNLIIVDFKTDRVDPEYVEEYAKRYALQVHYYAKALEQIRRKPVSAMYLAFLTAGRNIRV